MNDLPRLTLRRIIHKHGRAIAGDARRCESLLNDLCGSHRREINVLVNAVEERVPLDLLSGADSMPIELLLTRLAKQLEAQTAMTAEAASWAVESWALALDLTTETEIRARRDRLESAAPPILKTETLRPNDSAGKSPHVSRNNPAAAPPPSPASPTNVPPPTAPPINRQPPPPPKPSPPIIFPTGNQPAHQPSVQTPTTSQPTQQPITDRRSFGVFRGCLLVVLLLAAASIGLFFGVPFAIEKMRETQRDRNNEPPRFPAR